MPKKCEVIAERVSLVVSKGSVVFVDDRQFEIAKQFLKPMEAKVEKPVAEDKPAVIETREEKPLEKEVKSKKKKK